MRVLTDEMMERLTKYLNKNRDDDIQVEEAGDKTILYAEQSEEELETGHIDLVLPVLEEQGMWFEYI